MARINPKYVGGTVDDLERELERVPGYHLQRKLHRVSQALAGLMQQMRKAAGLTQVQVADKIDTSQPLVARLESENPDRMPTFMTIGRVADACGYDMELILRPRKGRNEVLYLHMKDYLA